MRKEPIAFFVIRILCFIAVVAFMAMIYWSSLLLEQDTKHILKEIAELRMDMVCLQSNPVGFSSQDAISDHSTKSRPHIDPSLPNILQEDPFYEDVLPKLLGPHFKPQGNFQSATIGKPENLHPFTNWAQASQWIDLCTVTAASSEFGRYETFSTEMAIKMEERTNPKTSKPEYWLHFRDGVFWQPLSKHLFSGTIDLAPHFLKKHAVTAHDFKFWFDALMNPFNQEPGAVSLRTYLSDIEDMEVVDDLTLIVRWKTQEVTIDGKTEQRMKYISRSWTGALKPLASFVYKYFPDGKKILQEDSDKDAYRKSSLWAQNFSQHWAKNVIPSCGAWIFDGLTDRQATFKRNPNFYHPLTALGATMTIDIKDAPDAIWQAFKAGKLDSYAIQPNQLLELEQYQKTPAYKKQAEEGLAIKQINYLAQQYAYVAWNQARPLFKSKKVRQALTMAIDRKRIIREYLNGRGLETTGTFYPASPSYDPSIVPLPFDLHKARQYLEEEGWYDSDGDGIIDKVVDGKKVPFKFTLNYYVQDPIRKSICEYITTALKEIGIVCQANGIDIADLSAAFDDKNFDAITLNWTTGSPPEDPRQLWYSSLAKEKGSANIAGFANPEADAIIDKLQYTFDKKERADLYHAFDRILYEEQPYTFLYVPKATLIYREYLQNVFIPAERQDLIPGADVAVPSSTIFWIKPHKEL